MSEPAVHSLADAISSGMEFLTHEHTKGFFTAFSSVDPYTFAKTNALPTTFFTSLITQCLSTISHPLAPHIQQQSASFLLSQKSAHWSYNYWLRDSVEAKQTPYPDDLDDTFCALTALFKTDPTLITGEVMASVVLQLSATEVKEGGPYTTWLVPQSAEMVWKDVDVAVNANLAYFLSLHDITLPNVENLLDVAINSNTLSSPYYTSCYPLIYFISRFYQGSHKEKLISLIKEKRDNGVWENPLNTALSVSALLNLGIPPVELEEAIQFILSHQEKGRWQPYPFYIDRVVKGKKHVVGAAALTTAYCLEALSLFDKLTAFKQPLFEKKQKKSELIVFNKVILQTQKKFSDHTPFMQASALPALEKMLEGDVGKQIALTPYYFYCAIGTKKIISQEQLITLGVANALGWLAYTLYDDFLDNEGDPTLLSVANHSLRELTVLFHDFLPRNTSFHHLFQQIMKEIDEANTWEVSNCRFDPTKLTNNDVTLPDYARYNVLAQKSFGHVLGPLALLSAIGYTKSSPEVLQTITFFKHYLIARQLNDDAHDWERDISMGQISPVVAMLLAQKKVSPLATTLSLASLQEYFWEHTVEDVCGLMEQHIRRAEKTLSKLTYLQKPEILLQLLAPIRASIVKTRTEREAAVLFMQTYQKHAV